jgi:hypothetical protein
VLLSEVSKGMLGLVLDSPDGDLSRVRSRASVDVFTKAALAAVAQHPEILVPRRIRACRRSSLGSPSRCDNSIR